MSAAAIILASGSAARRSVLQRAGVNAGICQPNVDEETVRLAMCADNLSPSDQAMQLAELKALKVSSLKPGLVIGGDQMLSLGELTFDKPADIADARTQLKHLSGQTHRLETALVVAENGQIVWRHLARPALTMRALTDDFIDTYLEEMGDTVTETVGCYRLEGIGIQLFTKIEGDYFSILGLPLLPLLDYLRTRGVIRA